MASHLKNKSQSPTGQQGHIYLSCTLLPSPHAASPPPHPPPIIPFNDSPELLATSQTGQACFNHKTFAFLFHLPQMFSPLKFAQIRSQYHFFYVSVVIPFISTAFSNRLIYNNNSPTHAISTLFCFVFLHSPIIADILYTCLFLICWH